MRCSRVRQRRAGRSTRGWRDPEPPPATLRRGQWAEASEPCRVHLDGAGADGAAPVSSRPAAVAKLFLHGPSPRFEGGDDRGIRRARLNRDRDHAHARKALASARSMLGGWIAPWQDGKRARRAPPANVPGASTGDRRQQRLGWSIMLAVSPVADGNSLRMSAVDAGLAG